MIKACPLICRVVIAHRLYYGVHLTSVFKLLGNQHCIIRNNIISTKTFPFSGYYCENQPSTKEKIQISSETRHAGAFCNGHWTFLTEEKQSSALWSFTCSHSSPLLLYPWQAVVAERVPHSLSFFVLLMSQSPPHRCFCAKTKDILRNTPNTGLISSSRWMVHIYERSIFFKTSA